MSTARRTALAVTSATLALAACGDATGPGNIPGAYTLARLGATPPPAPLGGTAGSGFTSLSAETLRLDAGGTAHLESQRRHGAGYGSNYSPSDAYSYTVVGDGSWELRRDTVVVTLNYTGDRGPFAGNGSYAGTLRLRPAGGGLTEYQGDTYTTIYLRTYTR